MQTQLWTVARFPSGTWSTGGRVTCEEYEMCEVYQIPASSRDEAKKKAQSVRSRLVKRQLPLPTQSAPYRAEEAAPSEVKSGGKIKLTPAQLKLLQEQSGGFSGDYKPGLKLIELGFIDVREAGFGHRKWTINDAGLAYLASLSK